MLPVFSAPIVIVTLLPDDRIAPDVVMTMRFEVSVVAMEPDREGMLEETTAGTMPCAKKPELYEMVMVPLMPSCVVGVNVNVTWTPSLFKRRSRGSIMTLAADTDDCAETSGNSRSCSTAAAAMAWIILFIPKRAERQLKGRSTVGEGWMI